MNACFWASVFVGLINMILVEAGISEIPFAKAHVKAHRKRICITVKEHERCIRMEKSPGDAEEIAKLFRVFIETSESSDNKKYKRHGPATTGSKPKQPASARSKPTKPALARSRKNIIEV